MQKIWDQCQNMRGSIGKTHGRYGRMLERFEKSQGSVRSLMVGKPHVEEANGFVCSRKCTLALDCPFEMGKDILNQDHHFLNACLDKRFSP